MTKALTLRLPRLGKRKLILALFVRSFDWRLFGFVCFFFLLMSEKGYSLWLWQSLDFSLTFFSQLQFVFVHASVVSYDAFVLSMYVTHLVFCRCFGNALLCNRGMPCVFSIRYCFPQKICFCSSWQVRSLCSRRMIFALSKILQRRNFAVLTHISKLTRKRS